MQTLTMVRGQLLIQMHDYVQPTALHALHVNARSQPACGTCLVHLFGT
jgi:hypothetical protein